MRTEKILSLLIAISLSFVLMFTLLIFCFSTILASLVTGAIPFGVISCFVGTAFSTFYGGKGISHIYNQLSKRREVRRKAEDILKESNRFFNKQAIWFIATGAVTVFSVLLQVFI
jgi:hypothetical protein